MSRHRRCVTPASGRRRAVVLLPPPLLLALLLLPLPPSLAQYITNSFLFNQTLGAGNALLTAQLRDHPDLETLFYPNKYVLPRDFYSFSPPQREIEYTQNVLFDPCRGYEYNCCFDTFGTPEYLRVESNASLPLTYGTRKLLYDDGSEMNLEISRRPDDELFIDESCEGENLPPGRTDCVIARVARRPIAALPKCWNYNETVLADASCRSPADGTELPLCLELGVTQTSFILECGGAFSTDAHCGTFLEIHRPARADKLSEVRLRAMYPSGYRMTAISTTYKGDETRVLCYDPLKEGRYELWWVMRTLYQLIVERRLPFQVTSPECDWDGDNNRYLPYATLFEPDGVTRKARVLAGLDPFDPTRLLFTRPRTEGIAGFPGKGMGSTLVPITASTYHPTAKFDPATWHRVTTYTYTPDKPEFTVRRGVVEPTIVEQAALAALIKKRGYRRMEDVGEEARTAMLAQVRAAAEQRALREGGGGGGGGGDGGAGDDPQHSSLAAVLERAPGDEGAGGGLVVPTRVAAWDAEGVAGQARDIAEQGAPPGPVLPQQQQQQPRAVRGG
jgi:hypothetical protein